MSNIIILSEPIRSGKTTLLIEWCMQNSDVKGISCPDIGGLRRLFIIGEKTLLPLEVPASNISENKTVEPTAVGNQTQSIGHFIFNGNSFACAQEVLLKVLETAPAYLLIDEVGKLEMQRGAGFEQALNKVIACYKNMENNPMHAEEPLPLNSSSTPAGPGAVVPRLLLVIRDYLLQDAIAHYGLQHAQVVSRNAIHSLLVNKESAAPQPLVGLVMCGGQSSRMGQAKALLHYHDKAQYKIVYEMQQAFCTATYIACKTMQTPWFDASCNSLTDAEAYGDCGPIAALLTAVDQCPDTSLLIMGCDYPAFKKRDLELLVQAYLYFNKSCCFVTAPGQRFEPLLAIYSADDLKGLHAFYKTGQQSLNKFLEHIDPIKIVADDIDGLRNYDRVEDYTSWKK